MRITAEALRSAAPTLAGVTLIGVPTTHPRYSVTDTGPVRELLDDAQRQWPEVGNRKELLLRLARAGHDSLKLDRAEAEAEASRRRERQRAALAGLQRLVDWGAIRDDQAWR
jgi:hypothetical protein